MKGKKAIFGENGSGLRKIAQTDFTVVVLTRNDEDSSSRKISML